MISFRILYLYETMTSLPWTSPRYRPANPSFQSFSCCTNNYSVFCGHIKPGLCLPDLLFCSLVCRNPNKTMLFSVVSSHPLISSHQVFLPAAKPTGLVEADSSSFFFHLLTKFKKLSCLWADLADTLVDGRGSAVLVGFHH